MMVIIKIVQKLASIKLQREGGIVTASMPLGIINNIISYLTIKSCGLTFTSGDSLIT